MSAVTQSDVPTSSGAGGLAATESTNSRVASGLDSTTFGGTNGINTFFSPTISRGTESVGIPPSSTPPLAAPTNPGLPGSSSNLYLYTFLATLVLLLFVSGAVILRSIMLRIRARRAIEEAIRNGTYTAPQHPPRDGANEVKPVLYDAHLEDHGPGSHMDEKSTKWSGLLPVGASFVASPNARASPQPAITLTRPASSNILARLRLPRLPLDPVQNVIDELDASSLHAARAAQARQPSQAELAAAAFATTPGDSYVEGEGGAEGGGATRAGSTRPPRAVRIAVLIAMPDPARPVYVRSSLEHAQAAAQALSLAAAASASSSSSTASKGLGKEMTPAADARGAVRKADDEPDPEPESEIPYLEFGIAEVPLASPTRTRMPAAGRPREGEAAAGRKLL